MKYNLFFLRTVKTCLLPFGAAFWSLFASGALAQNVESSGLQQTLQLQQQLSSDGQLSELYAKLKASPLDAALHVQLGKIYAERSLDELALASFNRALRLQPTLVSAHTGLAEFFHKRGQRNLELTSLTRAVELAPQDPDLHFKLGWLYGEAKSFDAAKAKKHYEILQKMGSPLAADLAKRLGIESK